MLVVAGEALIDLVIGMDQSVEAVLGGAPYNTARAASQLGIDVRFIGCLSQAAANKRNSERSTGPRTADGKARSATNALRHGAFARVDAITASVLGEDPAEIDALVAAIVDELDPQTTLESASAHTVATRIVNRARVDRLTGPLAEGAAPEIRWETFPECARYQYQYGVDLAAALELFERTTQLGDRVDRSVAKALDAYNTLRSDRPATPPPTDHEE